MVYYISMSAFRREGFELGRGCGLFGRVLYAGGRRIGIKIIKCRILMSSMYWFSCAGFVVLDTVQALP